MDKIRVIVVDDSALMRKVVSDMINSDSEMDVLATARNGQELLNKLKYEKPDVITLDVEMPVMDGITALRELKKTNADIPVIMLSSISNKGTSLTMDCLAQGAFDFIAKPGGSISLDISKVKDELIEKIKASASSVKKFDKIIVKKDDIREIMPMNKNVSKNINVVLIGASTGGPKALYSVITKLPKNLGVPVLVVQHMPVGFTKAFADRLNDNSEIAVTEARDGEFIERNKVYIAPGGFHMEVSDSKCIKLTTEPAIWGVRPAVDKLFISATKVYGSEIMSAVLTGMGRDGSEGTVEVKKAGGFTIAEDKSTCTIYGMPKAAYETGKVDIVLKLNEISDFITRSVRDTRR